MSKNQNALVVAGGRFLSEQEELFCQAMVMWNNRSKAIRTALPAETDAAKLSNLAAYYMRSRSVLARIDQLRAELRKATSVTITDAFERAWAIATADPNEISQLRRVNCRYCWGIDHKYQWVENDWYEECERILRYNALVRSADLRKELPDASGGFGFRPGKDPHHDCPKCGGDGDTEAFFADTRDLQGSARLLYAGTKVTKNGIEVMTHDQSKYMDMCLRMLGAYQDKLQLGGVVGIVGIPLNDTQRAIVDAMLETEY